MIGSNDHAGRRNRWMLVAGGLVALIVGLLALPWRSWTKRMGGLSEPASQIEPASKGSEAAGGRILYYQDPMHPWYRSDKPGLAPDCGMKLVPVYASGSAPGVSPPPGRVQISPARQQLMGITTVAAEYRPLEKLIRTVGQVAVDETRMANVHAKISGWVQRVFVDQTFQHVQKGDPLFAIYSPELVATQEEYLLARRAQRTLGASPIREVASGGESLLEAARRRLLLWDLTEDQIRQIEQSGEPLREVTVYSPTSGHVSERKVFPNQYITPETELYKLVDHSVVWVQAAIYESELSLVREGQEATLTTEAFPGRVFRGRVRFIPPHLMEETRTLPVRLEFPNPDLKLKPGMFVNVELRRRLGKQLAVPLDAVLDSGVRQIVVVDRGEGVLEPREVRVGERTDDYVGILSGLRRGERVVTRANFLVDSESNLRQAVAGMSGTQHASGEPSGAPSSSHPH